MSDFLTITEAAQFSGKSKITIRRAIKAAITQDNTLEHNQLIIKEKQGNGFTYRIKKDFINNLFHSGYGLEHTQDNVQDIPFSNLKENTQSILKDNTQEYIQTLKDQMESKDQQIKELHMLLGNLQNKLFLLEQPQAEKQAPEQPANQLQTKQSFLSRVFGKKQS